MPKGFKLEWHGDEIRRRIGREYERRILACCLIVERKAKELISVDGTGKGRRTRDAKGKYLKVKLRYGANPSAPGEPPHLQTGRLRGSVAHEVRDLVGRVGTNVEYGRWLELGTRLCKARPWLRRALTECLPQIHRIMTAPMKL